MSVGAATFVSMGGCAVIARSAGPPDIVSMVGSAVSARSVEAAAAASTGCGAIGARSEGQHRDLSSVRCCYSRQNSTDRVSLTAENSPEDHFESCWSCSLMLP